MCREIVLNFGPKIFFETFFIENAFLEVFGLYCSLSEQSTFIWAIKIFTAFSKKIGGWSQQDELISCFKVYLFLPWLIAQ